MKYSLTTKQLRKVTNSALAMVASANQDMSPYRQVTARAALTVLDRSFRKTETLPFSIREHLAIRDVSDFISVSQKNKTNLQSRRNTDLLPVCHPASTKRHAMTASALRTERARWYAADQRISTPEASALVASACSAEPFSAEQTYYLTKALNYEEGAIPLSALVAAFGGGNSRAARSARAKLQRRDRKGRFAWMGGGMSALVARRGGGVSRLSGRAIAQGVGNDNTFDIETPDGRLLRVPAGSSEASRAYLPSADSPDGFSPVEARDVGGTPTIAEDDLVEVEAPNGFRPKEYDGAGKQYTDDAYNVTKLDQDDVDQQEEIPDSFFERDETGRRLLEDGKPVYLLTREDGTPVESDKPMQSWADVQDAIRVDEIIRDREEGREPEPVALLDNDALGRVADIAEQEGGDPNDIARRFLGEEPSETPETPETTATDQGFNDPTGLDLVDDSIAYEPEGRTDQESSDYTDDPAVLAQRYSEEELTEALRESVSPNQSGDVPEQGNLEFDEGPEGVPAQALYEALKEQGADAPKIMQDIYDGIPEQDTPEAADPEREFFNEEPKSRNLNRRDPNQWTETYDGYTIDRWKDDDGNTFYRANVKGGGSKNFETEGEARRFAGEQMGVFEEGLPEKRAQARREADEKKSAEEWAARKPETGPKFSETKDEFGRDLFVEEGEDYRITRSVDSITGKEYFRGSWVKETYNRRTGETSRERQTFESDDREDVVAQINRDKGGSWVSEERPAELPPKPEKPESFWEQKPNSRRQVGTDAGQWIDEYDDYTIERSKKGQDSVYTGRIKRTGESRTFEGETQVKEWAAERLGVTEERPETDMERSMREARESAEERDRREAEERASAAEAERKAEAEAFDKEIAKKRSRGEPDNIVRNPNGTRTLEYEDYVVNEERSPRGDVYYTPRTKDGALGRKTESLAEARRWAHEELGKEPPQIGPPTATMTREEIQAELDKWSGRRDFGRPGYIKDVADKIDSIERAIQLEDQRALDRAQIELEDALEDFEKRGYEPLEAEPTRSVEDLQEELDAWAGYRDRDFPGFDANLDRELGSLEFELNNAKRSGDEKKIREVQFKIEDALERFKERGKEPRKNPELSEEEIREKVSQYAGYAEGNNFTNPDYDRDVAERVGKINRALDQGDLKKANAEAAWLDQTINNKGLEPKEATPEPEPEPVQEVTPDTLPELFEGLSDEEKQDLVEEGNYKDYLPENQEFDVPEGYYDISPEPFENTEENPEIEPVNLARDYDTEDLKDGLAESLGPDAAVSGVGRVSKEDEDGEETAISAPAEAIRDGLQMQGEDTNEFIDSVYAEGREAPEAEEVSPEEEIAEAPEAPEAPETPNETDLEQEEEERVADAVDAFLDGLDVEEEPQTVEPEAPEAPQAGTVSRDISTSDGKIYSVETRRNSDGTIDVVIKDSQGREFIESTGDESEIDQLNERADNIANSMEEEDEFGQLYKDLIDSEDPVVEIQEEKSDEAEEAAEESGELDQENQEIIAEREEEEAAEVAEEPAPEQEAEPGEEPAPEEEQEPLPGTEPEPEPAPGEGRFPEPEPEVDYDYQFISKDGRVFSKSYIEHLFTAPPESLTQQEVDDLLYITSQQMSKEQQKIYRARLRQITKAAMRRRFTYPNQSGFSGERFKSDEEDLDIPEKTPGLSGEGRTAPDPGTGTPSEPIVPSGDFYYVDPGGKKTKVKFKKEYVQHLFSSDPSNLSNQEIADFLTIYSQMSEQQKKNHSKQKADADAQILERMNGVEEPIAIYAGDRYEIYDGEGEEGVTEPSPEPAIPTVPDPESGYVPPKPKPVEQPVPGATRKSELNRRSREALKDLDKALRDLLDTGMPENFYPNLPQAERERLFNEMLADLEDSLETLRGAVRQHIKTKEGTPENKEALENIAALVDRASRRLRRIERGGGKAPTPDERDPAFISTSSALANMSDWIEDAIDPNWTPNNTVPNVPRPTTPNPPAPAPSPSGEARTPKKPTKRHPLGGIKIGVLQRPYPDQSVENTIDEGDAPDVDDEGYRDPLTKIRVGDWVRGDNGNWKQVTGREVETVKRRSSKTGKPYEAKIITLTYDDGSIDTVDTADRGFSNKVVENFKQTPDPTKVIDHRDGTFSYRGVRFKQSFGRYTAIDDMAGKGIDTSYGTPEDFAKNIDEWIGKDFPPPTREEIEQAIRDYDNRQDATPEPNPFDLDPIKYSSDNDRENLSSLVNDIADSISPPSRQNQTEKTLRDFISGYNNIDPEEKKKIDSFLESVASKYEDQTRESEERTPTSILFNEQMKAVENKDLLNGQYLKDNLKTLSRLIDDKDSSPEEVAYYANILNPVNNPKNPDPELDENPIVKAIRGNKDLQAIITRGLKRKGVVYDPSNPSEPFRPARADELEKPKKKSPAAKKPTPSERKTEEEDRQEPAETPGDEETPQAPEPTEEEAAEEPEAPAPRERRTIDPDELEFPDEEFPPTQEQREIIAAILNGDKTVVRALAGTGKTTTLRLAADKIREFYPESADILYLAFNRSIRAEAQRKMPENVTSSTFDALALSEIEGDPKWGFMAIRFKNKKDPGLVKHSDIATHFGVENGVTPEGEEVGASTIVGIALEAVGNFTKSSDKEISAKHFGTNEDGTPIDVSQEWIDLANAIWTDRTSRDGVLSIENPDINKRFALNDPDLTKGGADFPPLTTIFFDEAQDINPVIASLIKDQEKYGAQIVYVGDSNQAVYQFRGAVDELDNVDAPNDLPLTESWRFGPQIAGFANRFLALKGRKERVRGSGEDGVILEPGSMSDGDAIITRTTLGKFVAISEQLALGRFVTTDQNSRGDLIDFLTSARNLRFDNGPVTHKDLRQYSSWGEVIGAYRDGKLEGRARQFFDLLLDKDKSKALTDSVGSVKVVYQEGLTASDYIPEITADSLEYNKPNELFRAPVKLKRGRARKTAQTPKKVKYVVDKRIDPETGQELFDIYLYDQALLDTSRKFDVKRFGATFRSKDNPVDPSTGVPVVPESRKRKKDPVTKEFIKDEDGKDKIFITPERNRDNVWHITAESEEDALRVLNDLRDSFQGVPQEKSEVQVITGHVSKGLEFDRVKIDEDFAKFGPRINDDGEKVMPSEEEINLAYVAATRAKKELDPGGISWIYAETTEDDESPQSDYDSLGDLPISPAVTDVLKAVAINEDAFLKKDPELAKKLLEKMKEMPGQDKDEIDRIIRRINDRTRAPESPMPTKARKAKEKKNVEKFNENLPEDEKITPEQTEKILQEVEEPPDRIIAAMQANGLYKKALGGGQWQVWSKTVGMPGPDGEVKKVRYEVIIQKNKNNSFSVVYRTHDVTREGMTNDTKLIDEQKTYPFSSTQSYTHLRNTVGRALQEIRENSRTAEDLLDFWSKVEDRDIPGEEIRNPGMTHVSADGWTELQEGDRVYDHVKGRWGVIRIVRETFDARANRTDYQYTDYVAFQADGSSNYDNSPAKNFFKVDPETGNWIPAEGVTDIPAYWKGVRETEVVPPTEGYGKPPMSTRRRRQLREMGARSAAEERDSTPEVSEPEDARTPDEPRAPEEEPVREPDAPDQPPAEDSDADVDSEEDDDESVSDAVDSFLSDLDKIDIDPPTTDVPEYLTGSWTPMSVTEFESERFRKAQDATLALVAKSKKRDLAKKLGEPAARSDINRRMADGRLDPNLSPEEIDAEVDRMIDEAIAKEIAPIIDRYTSTEKIKKAYRSGRGSTVAVAATNVSDEQVDKFLETVDRLEALVPKPNMTYVITNKGVGGDLVLGVTVQSDHIMMIRGSAIGDGDYLDLLVRHQKEVSAKKARSKATTPKAIKAKAFAEMIVQMPDEELKEKIREDKLKEFESEGFDSGADGLLVLMAHEMGHAVDKTWSTEEGSEYPAVRTSDETKYKTMSPEGLTALKEYASKDSGKYGKSAISEAYAEAFGHWLLTGGDPKKESVRKIAEAFGWNEEFPEVARAKKDRSLIMGNNRGGSSADRNLESSVEEADDVPVADDQLRAMSVEGANPEVFSSEGRVLPGVSMVRMDDLPDASRKRLEAWAKNNDVDIDAISDLILKALEDEDSRNAGRDWYAKEYRDNAVAMAERTGYPVDVVTAVIAITSARNAWSRPNGSKPNLELAEKFLNAHKEGTFDGVTTPDQAREVFSEQWLMGNGFGINAIRLLNGDISIDEAVTGTKRRSFYNNGLSPEDSEHVTMDAWMGAYLSRGSSLSPKDAGDRLSGTKKSFPKYLTNLGIEATPAYMIMSEATMRAHQRAKELGYVDDSWLGHQTQAAAWEAIRLGKLGVSQKELEDLLEGVED